MMVVKLKNRHFFNGIAKDFGVDLHWGRDRLTVTNPETGSTMWWFYSNHADVRVLAEVVRNTLTYDPKWVADGAHGRVFHARGPCGVAMQNAIAERLIEEDKVARRSRRPRGVPAGWAVVGVGIAGHTPRRRRASRPNPTDPSRRLRGLPPFDPRNPWTVTQGGWVDDTVDVRKVTSHCCENAAREQARYLRACGKLDIEVFRRPPPPQRGRSGNAHIDPGVTPKHVCTLAPRFAEGEEDFDLRRVTRG